MLRDLRYALRSLRRSPGFVAVAVVCLGVGLGIATSVYAMIDAVVRPYVPYEHPERLFWLYGAGDGASGQVGRVEHIAAFRRASSLYESLIVVDIAGRQLPLEIGGQVVDGDVAVVGPEYFPFFGIRPGRGRFFRRGDGELAAVVTHDVWRGALAGGALDGASVKIDGRTYPIVGVLPRGAGDPVRSGVLLARRDGAADHCCFAVVRLRPGQSWSGLMQGLVDVAAGLERIHGTGRHRFYFAANTVRRDPFQFSEIHGALAAGGLAVLLIACANLANLMLARGLSRRRDLVVHVAVGATRAAVIRQMLWEATLVSLAGGLLGALATWWGASILRAGVPRQLRWAGVLQTEISWRVFAFGLVAALLSALLFGLAPALRASDVHASDVLKDGAGTTTGRTRGSWNSIVIAEVALTLVLLVGASLLVRTVTNLRRLHAEVATRGLLSGTVTVRDSVHYRFGRAAEYVPQAELLAMARGVPGVVAVASSSREGSFGCNLLGDQGSGPPRHLWVNAYTRVSQDYVRTRRLHVIAGRDFTEGDVGGAGAAIVDSVTAERLWPGGRAVGRLIKTCRAHVNTPWIPVVGVTRPSPVFNRMDPHEVAAAEVYVIQPDTAVRGLLVRVQGVESEAAELLMRAARTRYAGRLWAQFRPWRQEYDDYLAARRFIGRLFGAFGLLALALAATGLHGALAYGVSRRVREFAIRLALGADAPAIARLVVRDAAVTVLAGTAIGGAVGLWAGRFVDPWLYGMYFVDAPSLIAAELILFGAAAAACWTPVRRAMRADPVEILRAT